MTVLINPYRYTAAAGTPLLDTASAFWICKNTSTFYDSGSDALLDQIGSYPLRLGSTASSDTNDPTLGNDGTHERLAFDGVDNYIEGTATGLNIAGDIDWTFMFVATYTWNGTAAYILDKRGAAVKGVAIYSDSAGRLRAYHQPGGTANPDLSSQGDPITKATIALARRASDDRMSISRDANEAASTGAAAGISFGNEKLRFGSYSGGTNWATLSLYGAAVWIGTYLSVVDRQAAGAEILSLAAL